MSDTETTSVVIERTLDAPPDLVWRMWTEPQHFGAWYGPTGARITSAHMDVRVGGQRLLCMELDMPDGVRQMWFTGEYREVAKPTRLVYTEAMSDENGTVLPASEVGLPDGHPLVTQVTVELEAVDDRTKLVMTHAGIPADSPGAAGWQMAIDKLVAHLAVP